MTDEEKTLWFGVATGTAIALATKYDVRSEVARSDVSSQASRIADGVVIGFRSAQKREP